LRSQFFKCMALMLMARWSFAEVEAAVRRFRCAMVCLRMTQSGHQR
jgi:hypothetical protein